MPQTIQGQQLNTVTLPANDLATVTFGGGGYGATLSIMNYGPGKVMVSNNQNIVPSLSSTDCLMLLPGVGFSAGPVSGAVVLLVIADTASTIVSITRI